MNICWTCDGDGLLTEGTVSVYISKDGNDGSG